MKSVSLGVYYPFKEEGRPISDEPQIRQVAQAGVNKKLKKFKTVWHGFRGNL